LLVNKLVVLLFLTIWLKSELFSAICQLPHGSRFSLRHLCIFVCVCIPDSNRVLCPVSLLTGLQTSQPRFTADNLGEELISFGVVWYSCTCVYYAG